MILDQKTTFDSMQQPQDPDSLIFQRGSLPLMHKNNHLTFYFFKSISLSKIYNNINRCFHNGQMMFTKCLAILRECSKMLLERYDFIINSIHNVPVTMCLWCTWVIKHVLWILINDQEYFKMIHIRGCIIFCKYIQWYMYECDFPWLIKNNKMF